MLTGVKKSWIFAILHDEFEVVRFLMTFHLDQISCEIVLPIVLVDCGEHYRLKRLIAALDDFHKLFKRGPVSTSQLLGIDGEISVHIAMSVPLH